MGRTYSESTELIAREDRAADGTLRRDVIASKKTFRLDYSLIDNRKLALLEWLYERNDEALRIEIAYQSEFWPYDVEVKTYDVLIKAFSKKRKLAYRGGLWEDVTVEFVEV
jgi:hypothetical protein